ncbi:uncharacterized protein LOC123977590 isoform X3 [Micropterus dolomieu]|uniref:uncharacterized protein LOC123977590 isoform X3 n=1 Tax=Micropterus dolomieu TaxID=147949 RepID=UPI001E8ECBFE|nr:uncharacterized protein LOC123977590 isoform X3 [Micropterus dolomieu]
MIAVPTSSPLLAPFFREFFLVLNKAKTPAMAVSSFQQKSLTKVSYPEEVDVIVETLQGIFTRGSLQQHHELTLTTLRPGAPPVWLPQPKYGHTQMDPPPSFEPLQAQRIKKPAHCCVDVLRCVCGQGTTGQVDKASHEKWFNLQATWILSCSKCLPTHQTEVSALALCDPPPPHRNRIQHLKPQIVHRAGTSVIYRATLTTLAVLTLM